MGSLLSLSSLILVVYFLHRGLPSLAKSGLLPPWFMEAVAIYVMVKAVGTILSGLLLDNASAKRVILTATIIGTVGIMFSMTTPLGFGLGFGIAAVLMKFAPFAAVLKNKGDAFKIAPLAMAKSLGTALFILVIGPWIKAAGAAPVAIVLGAAFCGFGVYAFLVTEDSPVKGWDSSILTGLFKDKWFWALALYCVVHGWFNMIYVLAPAGYFKGMGLSGAGVANAVAGFHLFSAAARFPLAFVINKLGSGPALAASFLCEVAVIGLWHRFPATAFPLAALASPVFSIAMWTFCTRQWGPVNIGTTGAMAYCFSQVGSVVGVGDAQ